MIPVENWCPHGNSVSIDLLHRREPEVRGFSRDWGSLEVFGSLLLLSLSFFAVGTGIHNGGIQH